MKRTALLALILILASANAFATAPSVFPGGPYTGCRNTNIDLNGYATCASCTITGMAWTAPSGCTIVQQFVKLDQNRGDAVITCTSIITDNVSLKADNNNAESKTENAQLTISNRNPKAVLNLSPGSGNPVLDVTFTGFCEDLDGNSDIASCKINFGDGNTGVDFTTGMTHSYFTPNTYAATLTATDAQSATGTDSESIQVTAPAAPTINNKSPASGSSTNDTTPEISFDINGSTSGVDIATLKLFIDNAERTPTTTAFGNNYHASWTFADSQANGKVVYIGLRVSDTKGNSKGDVNWSFTVDTEVPTSLSIKINSDNTYTNSSSVTLSLGATGASQCRYKNDGADWGSWESYTPSKSWTLRDSDGTRTVYFQCKDAAGNETSVDSIYDSIVLDRQKPYIPGSFGASYDKTDDEVDLTWSKPDDRGESGIDHYCLFRGTGSAFSDMSQVSCSIDRDATLFENNASGLDDDRTYYYRIKAVDRAGNLSDASDYVSVKIGLLPSGDTSAPNLYWRLPATSSMLSGIVVLEVEAYDSQSGIRDVYFYVGASQIIGDVSRSGNYYRIDWNSASVANGTHVLKATAINNSGNVGYDAKSLTYSVTTKNAVTASTTPEQDSAKSAIDDADNAKEEAALLFNEANELVITLGSSAAKLLSDGSILLDEADDLFDDANYTGAEAKADAASAKFEQLLETVSIEEFGAIQVYAFSMEKLPLLLQGINLKQELADEAAGIMENFTVNRSIAFKEIESSGNIYYKAIVRLVIKNNGNERKAVQLIEVVPKGFAADSGQITASTGFGVVIADPTIKWTFSIQAGDEKEITYVLKENLSKEAADALIAKQPMQLFVVPPIVLEGDTAVAEADFTAAPAQAGFFALPDLSGAAGLGLVLIIVIAIAIALYAYYTRSGGSSSFGSSSGSNNLGMQGGFGKRLGGKFSGIGRAREKEQRPRWEFKG